MFRTNPPIDLDGVLQSMNSTCRLRDMVYGYTVRGVRLGVAIVPSTTAIVSSTAEAVSTP